MRASELTEQTKCCGCKLCGYICPVKAIAFEKDELGFDYPVIDESKCINCGKCAKSCPNNISIQQDIVSAYAAVNKNESQLLSSASGGVFAAIANLILSRGGVVYGAAMEKDSEAILKVSHIRVDSAGDLPKLQGSKYLQSEMGDVFQQIKRDLQQGKEVMFSGTPCQTAAVRSAFGSCEKLLLVDIICHGVPSQKLFTEYLRVWQRKNKKSEIESFSFRAKESGWGLCAGLTLKSANGKLKKIRIPCNASSYYKMFLKCEIYRESCYSCKYAAKERVGDLTLGDYWGIERTGDEYKQCREMGIELTKGISCVLACSEKGKKYLSEANLVLIDSDFSKIAKENGQLNFPSPCPQTRASIMSTYRTSGYDGLEKQYNKSLGMKKYVILLKNRIPPKIRMRARTLLGRR